MLKTHQLPHSEPQERCRMPGRLKCILIALGSLLWWPSLSSLAVKEAQATDKLQEETALMLRNNVKLFHSSWKDMGMNVNFDADYGTLDSRSNRKE